MVQSSHRYLVRDANGFAYRRRVPQDISSLVGLSIWKRRIPASDIRSAEKAVREIAAEHDALIAQLRGLAPPAKYRALEDRADDALGRLMDDPTNERVRAEMAAASEGAAKIKRAMIAAAEQRLDILPPEERAAVTKAGGLESFFSVAVSSPDVALGDTVIGFRRARGDDTEFEEATQTVRKNRARKHQQVLQRLGLASDDDIPDDPKNPRIKTAIEAWFAERKQQQSAVKRHRVAIRRFVELHGNIPVRDITRDMVRDYRARIEGLADQRRVPVNMRGGLADGASDGQPLPRVAAPTVERHLASIKALLTYCIEQGWIVVNVATGIRPPKDTRPKAGKRRPFTRDERIQLLDKVIEEEGADSDKAWFVRLCAYTGIRLQEGAQLARTNVRQLEGAWIIEVDDLDDRTVKSETSVKQIPLHPAIRDEFVAWARGGKGDRVFASFALGVRGVNKLSGDFARLMDRAGLTDPRLVFHSLRHTLKREMNNARLDPDMRRQILGHAGRTAHDEYAGASMSALADELARMPPLF